MASEENTLTIRYAADGSDDDIKEALKPYREKPGGKQARAKVLLRRALGLPEPQAPPSVVMVDEAMLRRIIRAEVQAAMASVAGRPSSPAPVTPGPISVHGAEDEA